MRSDQATQHEARMGVVYGVFAYGLWGLFPLFLKLLDGISPVQIVANRVIWALALLAIVMTITGRWRRLGATLTWRPLVLLSVSAVLLSLNWGTYVFAINSDQMVEASLGYFINPLVTVALAVVFLGERFRPVQWAAVGIACAGVLTMTVTVRAVPWIGLALAITFGVYGLIKKFVDFGAVESLTVETAILFPLALVLLVRIDFGSVPTVVTAEWALWCCLILLGPVAAVPLLAFNAAANRIPLSVLGLLQFISPTAVFILAVLAFNEPMSTGRWIGFLLIWAALAIFSVDAVRRSRNAGHHAGRGTGDPVEPDLEALEPT